MTDPAPLRPTDNAVFGPLKGGSPEPTYGGVLSFMRRRYSRHLDGVDAERGIRCEARLHRTPLDLGALPGPHRLIVRHATAHTANDRPNC